MTQLNPYAPPETIETEKASERMSFQGTIERADYIQLLPKLDLEVQLLTILLLLLGINLCGLSGLSVFLIARGNFADLGIVLLIGLPMGIIFYLGNRRIHSQRRADRWLALYPDVLGIAEGELSDEGLVFFDGLRRHWFGTLMVSDATCTRRGLRFHVGGKTHRYRYLAITARLFHAYDPGLASRIVKRCRENLFHQSLGTNLWHQVAKLPQGAIEFDGQLLFESSMRVPAVRRQAIVESLTLCGTTVGAWISWQNDFHLFAGLLATCAIAGIFTAPRAWYGYFRGTSQHSWTQHGWISPDEIAYCDNRWGVRMPLSLFKSAEITESMVTIKTESTSAVIAKEHLRAPEQWQRVIEICQAIGAPAK